MLEKAGLGGLGRAADTSGDNVDSFLRGEHGHHTVESYISFQSDIRWVQRPREAGHREQLLIFLSAKQTYIS